MVSFQKVWPWNKVKGFDVFSVIRLKSEVDFFSGKCLEVFYFCNVLIIVAKRFEEGFLRSFIPKYMFPVIAN